MNISEVNDCAYLNNRDVKDILILNNFNILLKALSKQQHVYKYLYSTELLMYC